MIDAIRLTVTNVYTVVSEVKRIMINGSAR